ncbi:MAG: EamA family transporter [Thermomicrobiales bacterium]|nr:EamA family transporter [Thermomicrobiales bacterium]
MAETTAPSTTEQTTPTLGTPFLPEMAAIAIIFVWASTFTITKSLYGEMSPLAFGAARFIVICSIAFLVLGITAKRSGNRDLFRIRRADIPLFIFTGVLGYTCYQLGFIIGLEHTSPFAGSLMIATSTPLVSLLIVRILGERQSGAIWLGALLAILGVTIFLFSGDGGSKPLGNIIAFSGGVAFAIYQVMNRRLVREYHSATYSAWSTLLGSVPLILLGTPAMIDQSWGSVSTHSWLAFIYMCILPVYVAYMVWGWAIRHRGVAITGFTILVPIVAGVISWIFYDEAFTARKLLGGGVAVLGLVLMQWANHRQGTAAGH